MAGLWLLCEMNLRTASNGAVRRSGPNAALHATRSPVTPFAEPGKRRALRRIREPPGRYVTWRLAEGEDVRAGR